MTAPAPLVHLALPDAEATARLARRLAPRLGAGDTLLLDGPIGAGKTHFARALIQALLPVPEDVPSPTFTLVQTYQAAAFEIWHCDLYRLSTARDVLELGLDEAFGQALCLVEWPDRLGDLAPADALRLRFETPPGQPDARRLTLSGAAARWGWLRELADA
jgi:tRNA threonylcarbamoyladenosine biosynthesis protein TsaE